MVIFFVCFLFCFVCLFFLVLFFISRWGTRHYMSLFQSISLPVRCAPYCRNRTSSSHNFWCKCVKWWYIQVFFFFFIFLKFWGKRVKNGPKCKVTITYIAHHISGTVCQYDHDFWYICAKWWYLQVLFSFSEIFVFWAVMGVKGQRIAQSEK